jgi:hypothetical protein
METKYIIGGIAVLFIVLAIFASNLGEKAKRTWSSVWCLGVGEHEKPECIDRVYSSTEMGSSLSLFLLVVGLIMYIVRKNE